MLSLFLSCPLLSRMWAWTHADRCPDVSPSRSAFLLLISFPSFPLVGRPNSSPPSPTCLLLLENACATHVSFSHPNPLLSSYFLFDGFIPSKPKMGQPCSSSSTSQLFEFFFIKTAAQPPFSFFIIHQHLLRDSAVTYPLSLLLPTRKQSNHSYLPLPIPSHGVSLSLLIHSIITHHHQWDDFKHSKGQLLGGNELVL